MTAPTDDAHSKIGNGPDFFALAGSLKEPVRSPKKPVVFHVDSGQRRPLGPRNTEQAKTIYNEVQVCVCFLAQGPDEELFLFEGWIPGIRFGNIHGMYSTRTRKGWYGRGHRYSVIGYKNEP